MFYQLRQLRSVCRALTVKAARTLVHAFIISRVDYCKCLRLYQCCPPKPSSIGVECSRLLDRSKIKFDRIMASIRDELHLLLVLQRYNYKLCLHVYKCLHRSAPSYFIDQCVLNYTCRERLRSASHGYLTCPRYKTRPIRRP